jgi:hypothetical protein
MRRFPITLSSQGYIQLFDEGSALLKIKENKIRGVMIYTDT